MSFMDTILKPSSELEALTTICFSKINTEEKLKIILSLMLIIASIFMAQSAFAMDVQVKEALTPPDVLVSASAISAPDMTYEFVYKTSPTVTLQVNELSQLNGYILNNSSDISTEITLTAGFWNDPQEVETVLKFPYLIRTKS